MKYKIESSFKKKYIEIIPTISFSWFQSSLIYIGWLFWSLVIEF